MPQSIPEAGFWSQAWFPFDLITYRAKPLKTTPDAMKPQQKRILRAAPPKSTCFDQKLHPVLRRVYALRGLLAPEELDLALSALLPVSRLSGVVAAAALLGEALCNGQKILVLADFDADGATSCALAVRALRGFGAAQVDYLVPNRFEFGYGLTPEIVAVARQREPDLILTVDNGISSLDGVAAAKRAGIRVLITDHHLPGRELPDADAIVNPNCADNAFPSKHLAGVGVVFYLMVALRRDLQERGWFSQQRIAAFQPADLLDLVALGTVADVVPLDHNNRILVAQGLHRIRSGHCCSGVRALVERAGRSLERLVASDLGFAVGPRLNAAGRLEDMSLGIECLLTDAPVRARELAARLDELNHSRRQIEEEMKRQALGHIDALPESAELPYGVVLYDPEWHQGVIGILAARIRERCGRPVIAFARGAEPGLVKGSARSISGLHIRDLLDSIAAANPGLLHKFGGHAMAAGMSLQESDLARFGMLFDAAVRDAVDASALQGDVRSDGELEAADLEIGLAELIRDGGPWGQGFEEPLFDGVFCVVSRRVLGQKHLKMVLEHNGRLVDAIAFNQAEFVPDEESSIHAAYRVDVNEYRGRSSLQLVVVYLRANE